MRSATSRSGTSLVAGIVVAGAFGAPGSEAPAQQRAFTLPRAGRRVDVVLNWARPANRFSFATITALGSGDRVLATLSGRGRPRKLSIRQFSGSTFRSLDIRRPQGARRLRVTIKPSALTSSEPTVTQLSARG